MYLYLYSRFIPSFTHNCMEIILRKMRVTLKRMRKRVLGCSVLLIVAFAFVFVIRMTKFLTWRAHFRTPENRHDLSPLWFWNDYPAEPECMDIKIDYNDWLDSNSLREPMFPGSNNSRPDSPSHLLVPRNHTVQKANESVTRRLWAFNKAEDQVLYLTEKLLQKEWFSNSMLVDSFRKELAHFSADLSGSSNLILHRKNTNINDNLTFIYGENVSVVTPEFHKLLPEDSTFSPTRTNSCAVIGNSGALKGSACGAAIDKHNYVFRCNLAPLKQFKDDAGMKSGFITMNPSIVVKQFRSLKSKTYIRRFCKYLTQYRGMIWIPCFNYEKFSSSVMKAMNACKGLKAKLVCGHPTHFKSVRNFWSDKTIEKAISTGFYLVTTAFQLCDEISLYGFWPFSERFGDSKKQGVSYHYFDKMPPTGARRGHSMNQEFDILLQLHNLGVLRLHLGGC